MKARFGHLQINVSDPGKSFPPYKAFFEYLGYKILMEEEDFFGVSNGSDSIFVMAAEDKYKHNKYHRKNPGINHICFIVDSKEDVDKFYEEFLKPSGGKTLYDTPKAFPEYTPDYYAVFFEDPDRIKLEIAYIG